MSLIVNLEIGKVFSLNSQENLQLRISPVVSSRGRLSWCVLGGGRCLYHCFVCEFVVSFDRIIWDPREEGEDGQDSQYSQGGPEVSRDSPAAPSCSGGEACGSLAGTVAVCHSD